MRLVEVTLLILKKGQYYSLLELVDALPRWLFSVPDLLQMVLIRPSAMEKLNSLCLENIFIYRHHVEPESNFTRRERSHSQFH